MIDSKTADHNWPMAFGKAMHVKACAGAIFTCHKTFSQCLKVSFPCDLIKLTVTVNKMNINTFSFCHHRIICDGGFILTVIGMQFVYQGALKKLWCLNAPQLTAIECFGHFMRLSI